MVLYATLPVWFKVPTPLGSYTPDLALGSGLWALGCAARLRHQTPVLRVVGSQGSLLGEDLRGKECAKTECGPRTSGPWRLVRILRNT